MADSVVFFIRVCLSTRDLQRLQLIRKKMTLSNSSETINKTVFRLTLHDNEKSAIWPTANK